MLSNFSKVSIIHISFTAVINNGGIGKGIGGIQKGTKNYTFCNLLRDVRDEKKNIMTSALIEKEKKHFERKTELF